MPARVIAGCLALTGFAVAILAGLAAGNPTLTILVHALIAMAACYAAGMIIGAVAYRAITEHVEHYKTNNPIPRVIDLAESDETAPPIEVVDDAEQQQADAA